MRSNERKKKMRKFLLFSLIVVLVSTFTGCLNSSKNETDPSKVFHILTGSENDPIIQMIKPYIEKNGYVLQATELGSIDSMNELKKNPQNYDAVWLPNSAWMKMGDTSKKLKYDQSIFTSPVAFGITKSKAKELGFIGKDVTVQDILQAVKDKKLSFLMTSATQSNSGTVAYIGFVNAILNNPDDIKIEDLHNPSTTSQLKQLFAGVNRSSGSSGWLEDLFLKGNYEAMVNYEAVLIDANQKLVKQGKEPLYIVYPTNGLSIADNSLGYIDNGDSKKEAFFKQLQSYLLSDSMQKEIAQTGRRTGFGGEVKYSDKAIFNPDWGVNTTKVLSPIPFPKENVLNEMLTVYQNELRKPSYTVFVLDYSGSMAGDRSSKMKQAINTLLDPNVASQYYLQASDEDVTIAIPFNNQILNEWKQNEKAWTIQGPSQGPSLMNEINGLSTGGGTDIYSPTIQALSILKTVDTTKYNPAVILMTDGESNTGRTYEDLQAFYKQANIDIPVFSIKFGDASQDQLDRISNLTRGRTFNGTTDLIKAFKQAKGYN